MQQKIRVVLLGTNRSVLAVFRRHRHDYLILHQKGNETSFVIVGEQQPHLVVLVGDDLHVCQQARQTWPTLPSGHRFRGRLGETDDPRLRSGS